MVFYPQLPRLTAPPHLPTRRPTATSAHAAPRRNGVPRRTGTLAGRPVRTRDRRVRRNRRHGRSSQAVAADSRAILRLSPRPALGTARGVDAAVRSVDARLGLNPMRSAMSGRKPRPAPACQCPARPTHRPHGTVTTLLRTDTGTAFGPVGPSPPRHGRMPSTPVASLWQTSPTTAFSNAECGRSSPVARSSTGTAQACRRASRASSHTPPAPPSSAPPHDEKPPHSRQAIFGPSPRATHRATDTVFPGTTPPPARAPLAPDLPTTPRPGSSIRGMPTPPRPPSNPDERIATPAAPGTSPP